MSWFERVPYKVLALPLRFAVATVFWNSGTEKLADWNATLALFRDEYKVPLLPPDFAAHLAASIELSTPVLLVLGLLTRPAALVLLVMTTSSRYSSTHRPGPRTFNGRRCSWCCYVEALGRGQWTSCCADGLSSAARVRLRAHHRRDSNRAQLWFWIQTVCEWNSTFARLAIRRASARRPAAIVARSHGCCH